MPKDTPSITTTRIGSGLLHGTVGEGGKQISIQRIGENTIQMTASKKLGDVTMVAVLSRASLEKLNLSPQQLKDLAAACGVYGECGKFTA